NHHARVDAISRRDLGARRHDEVERDLAARVAKARDARERAEVEARRAIRRYGDVVLGELIVRCEELGPRRRGKAHASASSKPHAARAPRDFAHVREALLQVPSRNRRSFREWDALLVITRDLREAIAPPVVL